MILSASAGSGHVRAAQAIEEACRADERISDILNVDSLEYTNAVFQKIYSEGYLEAIKKAPDLWAWAFEMTDKPWQRPPAVTAIHKINSQPLVKKILDFKPDICLCTHGMPAEIISNLILQDKLETNLGIVVTDYYVHALWVMDIFTRYFVAKPESKEHLCALGLPPDRIVVSGIPVLQAFADACKDASDATQNSCAVLKTAYGFDESLPLVLLSAGAFGVMSAADIFKILQRIRSRCQIVVVCGRNEKLKNDLETLIEKNKSEIQNQYSIIGYTDSMHDYLRMADVFVGKPGGLSTSECLVAGVPMVIWDPIPGQELHNSYHILEHGAAVMPNNALTIGFKVDQLLQNPDRLHNMKKNAQAISFPYAAKTIVDAMLEHEGEVPVKAFKRKG